MRISITNAARLVFASMRDFRFRCQGWELEEVALAISLDRQTLPWK